MADRVESTADYHFIFSFRVKTRYNGDMNHDPLTSHLKLFLRRHAIGLLLALAAFAAVSVTIKQPGPVWDEPFYLYASNQYVEWMLAPDFSRDGIDAAWKVNHEHPPLAKVWIGAVRLAISIAAPGASPLAASRLATALLFAMLVLVAWAWGSRAGRAAGVASALFIILMPRMFAHAHFATLDMAMAFAWFATAYAFFRGIEDRRWAVAAGVLFGMALLTKINAWFIPLPLIGWALIVYRRKALQPLALLLGIGLPLFFIGWPWLWPAPVERLQGFLFGTTIDRAPVPVQYLGTIYNTTFAPWHYPIVLTLATVPLFILVCCGIGIRFARRLPKPAAADFAIWNAAAILVTAALPFVPKYDGVRLFLPLFPFIALLAGFGFSRLWEHFSGFAPRSLLVALICLAGSGTIYFHPVQTSYYNGLVGSLPGASRIGLETSYWLDAATPEVFDRLRAAAESRETTRLAIFPKTEALEPLYRIEGLLPEQVEVVTIDDDFDFALILNREGMLLDNAAAHRHFKDGRLLHEVQRLGVPIVRLVAK